MAKGGMGVVDLVVKKDGQFQRLYARKRLYPGLREDPGARSMFVDEGRLAGLVRHPNVVSVMDVGDDADGPYLIMDYVDGLSVAQIIEQSSSEGLRLPIQIAVRIVLDATRGLAAAHDLTDTQGNTLKLVHRDVSPHNILVGWDGIARVTDFGIAKALGNTTRTSTGVLKGNMGYMSPEQLRFESPDRRSDLFSLGITLFELLAGRRLYRENNGDAEGLSPARRILNEPPPDIGDERDDIPPLLCELVFELLTKDPEHRPSDGHALAARLENILAALVSEEGALDVSEFLASHFAETREKNLAERNRQLAEAETLDNTSARRKPKRIIVAGGILALGLAAVAFFVPRGNVEDRSIAPSAEKKIWAGGWHTCALDGEKLYCWGKNNEGQLGIGDTLDRPTRGRVELVGVDTLSLGSLHTCACTKGNEVYCWGSNHDGQLGTGNFKSQYVPMAVPATGKCQSVSAGSAHTCVLRIDGTVLCFGANKAAQLGDGTREPGRRQHVVSGIVDAVQLSSFRDQTCARLKTGTVLCWGDNSGSRYGAPVLEPVVHIGPTPVPLPDVVGIRDLAIGRNAGCVTDTLGTVACWGKQSTLERYEIDSVRLVAGLAHVCSQSSTGTISCWGANFQGQAGLGVPDEYIPNPTEIPGIADFSAVAVGEVHTCAWHGRGLSCWGFNATGQLGDGTADSKNRPISVAEFPR
jgi:eukaryotic-like serine/threonine-protein kinase